MSREKTKKVLEDFGEKIVSQIKKGKNPEIEMALRNLSNIIYDTKNKILKLGDKVQNSAFKKVFADS